MMDEIYLAPMHGIMDAPMRAFFTALGDYDYCVSEFMRISSFRLSRSMFHRLCPELLQHGCSAAQTPIVLQLLGDDPELMAWHALRAVQLGAKFIDLNFGCPSPLVNRHAGGAVLLLQPTLIYQIVTAVRQVLPPQIVLSAKIRLGYDNTDLLLDNAQAVAAAGANRLIVHARTRRDAYQAPARWEYLAKIREAVAIPVVANGDINSLEAYLACRAISGCQHVMLGRGVLAQPDLARQIRAWQQQQVYTPISWPTLTTKLHHVAQQLVAYDTTSDGRFLAARFKHWLKFLQNSYPEAQELLQQLRQQQYNNEVLRVLATAAEMQAASNQCP